ncbi:MAG TPA: DUF58 domain-containing protein [Actinomycetota bacterium]|jgi:uncharacterized protein (DUF58 family)|nr:DUF58 domain-containing protein [Actinomycetota bacterium]
MPSGRGTVVLVAGLVMWFAGRLVGSPGLAVIGVGFVVLPLFAATFTRWGRQNLTAERRLSDVRVAPGTRVTVEIDVGNRSLASTSFLMIEDKLPSALGRSARLVLTGMPSRGQQRAQYSLLPQTRGSYAIGPLKIDVSDPFALSRLRLQFDERDELLVTPEIEDLTGSPGSPFGTNFGSSRAKHLFRTGEEFYTMREYQTGDDLRRLHWPSVARTGELMIRQDESSRRSTALVFVDTREAMLGTSHGLAFERAISCAASVGLLLAHGGFSLRVATSDTPPAPVTEDAFLDVLAGVSHTGVRSIASTLTRLRTGSGSDTTLVVVAAPPVSTELPSVIRAGAAFGPKLAVLVHPNDPAMLAQDRRSQLEGRASQARHTLTRSGWDVVVLSPSSRLRDVWHEPRAPRLASSV